jgi:hypothetical protein
MMAPMWKLGACLAVFLVGTLGSAIDSRAHSWRPLWAMSSHDANRIVSEIKKKHRKQISCPDGTTFERGKGCVAATLKPAIPLSVEVENLESGNKTPVPGTKFLPDNQDLESGNKTPVPGTKFLPDNQDPVLFKPKRIEIPDNTATDQDGDKDTEFQGTVEGKAIE